MSSGGDSARRLARGPASSSTDVDAFLARAAHTPRPGAARLVFAMDATASRQAAWDRAMALHAEMFTTTQALGGLAVQLCYFRGYGEFRATPWQSNPAGLLTALTGVRCLGGLTQIQRVLEHAAAEHDRQPIKALVMVGDSSEEDIDKVCHAAGQLALRNVPAFMFHEGHDPAARRTFEAVAELTRGACCPFDPSAANALRDLLGAVAVYAAGGQPALEDFAHRRGGAARRLLTRGC